MGGSFKALADANESIKGRDLEPSERDGHPSTSPSAHTHGREPADVYAVARREEFVSGVRGLESVMNLDRFDIA